MSNSTLIHTLVDELLRRDHHTSVAAELARDPDEPTLAVYRRICKLLPDVRIGQRTFYEWAERLERSRG